MNPKRWTDNKDLIKTIIKNRPQRRLPPFLHTSPSKMLSIVVQATCLGIFPTISSNLFHFHQLASSTHHMTATKWEGMRFLWDAWSQPTATFWTAVPAMPLGSWTHVENGTIYPASCSWNHDWLVSLWLTDDRKMPVLLSCTAGHRLLLHHWDSNSWFPNNRMKAFLFHQRSHISPLNIRSWLIVDWEEWVLFKFQFVFVILYLGSEDWRSNSLMCLNVSNTGVFVAVCVIKSR